MASTGIEKLASDLAALESDLASSSIGGATIERLHGLVEVANGLAGKKPSTEASAVSPAGAPAPSASSQSDAAGQLTAMANGCEDCRAKAAGEAPAHDLDMMRHVRDGHLEKLVKLLDELSATGAHVFIGGPGSVANG